MISSGIMAITSQLIWPTSASCSRESNANELIVENSILLNQQVLLASNCSSATTATTITTQQQQLQLMNDTNDNHQQPHQWLLGSITNNNDDDALPLTHFATNYLIEPMYSLEFNLNYYFQDIWSESGDERTNKLPFIGSTPWKLIYATLAYLYLIKCLLPRLMLNLKPFELNWPIRLYNLSMVLSNIWAFYHGARILNFGLKCFGCQTINHRDYSVQSIELLHYGWLFFLSRLIEWLDTIFFVLRKKDKQVTKLHVFHHSFVPLISWTYLKYHPGYTMAFFPFVNSLVHSIMYTYYLLATFGTAMQPYLWWKRYLTSLQIVQFVLILIQLASIPLTSNDKCQYPRGFLYVAFAGAILFLWLFYTYYVDTYYTKKSKQQLPVDRRIDSKEEEEEEEEEQQQQSLNRNDLNNAQTTTTMKDNQKTAITTTKILPMTLRDRADFSSMMMLKNTSLHLNRLLGTRKEPEGTTRALADAIENAIGSYYDSDTQQTDSSVPKLKQKKKIV